MTSADVVKGPRHQKVEQKLKQKRHVKRIP